MKDLVQSALINPKISIVLGGGCACQAWMKRAVVDLLADISAIMPQMSRLIKGCNYNPGEKLIGFRYKDMGVIVEAQKITINNAEDEAMVRTVIDWLRRIIHTTTKGITKVEVN